MPSVVYVVSSARLEHLLLLRLVLLKQVGEDPSLGRPLEQAFVTPLKDDSNCSLLSFPAGLVAQHGKVASPVWIHLSSKQNSITEHLDSGQKA